MKIEMIQEDILPGMQCRSSDCPVAKAIARTVGAGKDVQVGPHVAFIYEGTGDEKTVRRFELPQNAIDFVRAYDRCDQVYPISFELVEKDPPTFESVGVML